MSDPEIKVTHINNRWHARLIQDGKILDEMACNVQSDIGLICREMLRWYDKNGGSSEYASKARSRYSGPYTGKVWYRNHLEMEK